MSGAFCGAFISNKDKAKPFIGMAYKVRIFYSSHLEHSNYAPRERILHENLIQILTGRQFNQQTSHSVPRRTEDFTMAFSPTSLRQAKHSFPLVSDWLFYRPNNHSHIPFIWQILWLFNFRRFTRTTHSSILQCVIAFTGTDNIIIDKSWLGAFLGWCICYSYGWRIPPTSRSSSLLHVRRCIPAGSSEVMWGTLRSRSLTSHDSYIAHCCCSYCKSRWSGYDCPSTNNGSACGISLHPCRRCLEDLPWRTSPEDA